MRKWKDTSAFVIPSLDDIYSTDWESNIHESSGVGGPFFYMWIF